MFPIKHLPTFHTDDIPKWKQDLMERRKSSSRTIVSAGGTVKLTVTRPVNMIKPIARSSTNTPQRSRPHSIHIDTWAKSDSGELHNNHSKFHSVRKSSGDIVLLDEKIREKLKSEKEKKAKVNIKLKINDEDYHSDSSDDVFSNEGVNAIKDKYLNKCSSPPPVSNLEKKAISLEDICQIDSTRLKPKFEAMRRPRQFKINQYQAKYLETIKVSNNSSHNLNSKPVTNGQMSPDHYDTPTKNLVKQRAQLFESNPKIKIEKPFWDSSNAITISFKDRADPIQEDVTEDFSKTTSSGLIDMKPSHHIRTYVTKKQFQADTNFSTSNIIFPELSTLDNSQNTGHKTLTCA